MKWLAPETLFDQAATTYSDVIPTYTVDVIVSAFYVHACPANIISMQCQVRRSIVTHAQCFAGDRLVWHCGSW